ncbi:extracellular metallo proteinase 2 [Amniculicola lignicola CBS 123094]|uniref:Extracellular metalloproteinase n=1 Tax=Amniculicola lignicola CBS 123094 TaxID=1392246 RepID=A0A6A5WMJ3_9PLEO|nr:extracellular metallo proteinase 2 [Amniculicola lignicola CBS 123094]
MYRSYLNHRTESGRLRCEPPRYLKCPEISLAGPWTPAMRSSKLSMGSGIMNHLLWSPMELMLEEAATKIVYPQAEEKLWAVAKCKFMQCIKRAIDLDSLRLSYSTKYTDNSVVETDQLIGLSKRADDVDTATDLVRKTVPGATFRLVEDFYVGINGIAHFNFKQQIKGIDIDNADFNVNILNGEVFSFGNSFYEGKVPESLSLAKRDAVDPVVALKGAVTTLQLPVDFQKASAKPKEGTETFALLSTTGTVREPEAKLVYLQTSDDSIALTWRIETDVMTNWLLTYVDAISGSEVKAVVDYSADATYQVYPWGLNDPTEGSRELLTDPFDDKASEFGWHSDGTTSYKTTRGNNGIAQSNWDDSSNYLGNPRPSDPEMSYVYPYPIESSDWKGYSNASITQLFYTSNMYHDLLYKLGFTEAAGNFELNNNDQGGRGNDFVVLNAQDGSGMNNANFATPPDGQTGRMRMYMWNTTTPWRDCSFDAGVIIHEYSHGLSNRLTGGPANSNCLSVQESAGMGEGWGDFMATAIRLKPGDTRDTDYGMGAWVKNAPSLRPYLYSTNMKTNPHVYKDNDALVKVHFTGTVWATMLYEVMWNLIDKYGKNDAGMPTFENGVPTDGKFLIMKLVVDGMALQPCNPTFVSARDAILDADKALTGGVNACEIWTGFAKRGLGEGAVYKLNARTNSFVVPSRVC